MSRSFDALATARAALREPELPVAVLDGPERELKLLVDYREDLVQERTRIENRLLWDLHELAPGYSVPPGSLKSAVVLDDLEKLLAGCDGLVAEIARDRLEQVRRLTKTANGLENEISRRAREMAPSLLALPGCGALTAAKLIGETARAGRFSSRAAFALHNGTAPIPVSSGRVDRHRLNRGGNRQINCALHRIAVTQLRLDGPGRSYVDRRISSGDTKTEAIRALRRRISDEVFRRLRADELTRAAGPPCCVSGAA